MSRGNNIPALKRSSLLDPNYADKSWKILEHGIHHIFNDQTTKVSFEELYRSVYDMVLQRHGERLYSGLVSTITLHIQTVSKCIEAAAHDGSFVEDLSTKWNDHNKALERIRDVFMHMERTFIPSTHKTPILKLGLNLWRDNLIRSENIRSRLTSTLLERILRERNKDGQVINQSLMRSVITMLIDVGPSVYQECLEGPFLEASEEFYRAESERLIERWDCWEYLREAERRLDEEAHRVSRYLDATSGPKIARVVEEQMIGNHMQRLVRMVNSSLPEMLSDDDKLEGISRVFKLFQRVPNGLAMWRDVMASHVRDAMYADIERSENPTQFVEALLEKRDKYDKKIRESLNDDMAEVLHLTFDYLVNLNPCCPEYVSLFMDDKLRRGFEGVKEAEIEETLDKAVDLIRCIHDKDVFEKHYRQHLAKRLLSGNTLPEDAERILIAKLKTVCGYQFTMKLEAMTADMQTSRDTMKGFYVAHRLDQKLGPALVVRVLESGSWPTKPGPHCNLPSELSSPCEKFESYYVGTHAGRRRLSWETSMGSAEITASFANGERYELGVSTHQMCVLMLFNDSDLLTYEEIERATEIPRSDLKMCLHSLACIEGKNILRKEPVSADKIGEGDVFYVNDRFKSELGNKVKIGGVAAPQMESEPEKEETRQRVEEDRKPQIDSAIVRVMKSRRVLGHNSLTAEVTKELQPLFLANPSQVKKRIVSLIQRDFLERDDVDRSLYRYVA